MTGRLKIPAQARRALPRAAAVLGALTYLLQAWGYAHTQSSVMDEGDYLLKGLYFARGVYAPFQDYGFWTNHMPLSALIPGWVQAVLGAGLRTGRLYALALALLMLAGLWLAARRLAETETLQATSLSPYFPALTLWAAALNPALIKMYAQATSQVLIAAMLVWTLALTLGAGRRRGQILAGAALSGLMALTRVNLAPFVPLLLLYVFWRHGWRAGWQAAGVAAAVILAGHALFWPNILRAWAAWAPPALTPFLAAYRPPPGVPLWNPALDAESRLLSFLFGVRFHFLGFAGLLVFAFCRRRENFRETAFLAASFCLLLLAHAWAALGTHAQTDAALGSDYCVFCFPVYTAFYSLIGILLLGGMRGLRGGALPGAAASLLLAAVPAALGFGAYRELYPALLRWRVPRLRTLLATGEWAPGNVPLWEFLQTQWGWAYETSKRLVPALAGLGAGLLLLGAAWLVWRSLRRAGRARAFASVALAALVGAGALLSPSPALGGGYTTYDCSGNVIAAHEAAGAYLRSIVPPNAKIYWQGSLSPAPLLYLDNPQILPPQSNLDYTYRLTGDTGAHLRFGFWTETAARDWLAQADFALVAERYLTGWLAGALAADFRELPRTVPLAPCEAGSYLRVFGRGQP
jgi:hypothetical protein